MQDALRQLRPLSAAQLGVWIAQELAPGTAIYNIAEYVEIHGPIDSVLFETALRQIVGETQTFHLRFEEGEDGPRQLIGAVPDWSLQIIDVSAEANPREVAEAWMRAETARPIDPKLEVPFGQALFRFDSDHFAWYHRGHHIVIDAFGASLVAKRLAQVYTALVAGQPPEPSPFGPIFSLLETDEEYLASDGYARDRHYWLAKFDGNPEPVSLIEGPSASPRHVLRQTDYLPTSVLDALREVARQAGTTWTQTIIAVMAAYLHRMTGANEIILGLPVLARVGPALRRVPGMASNVLPLRLDVQRESTLLDLVRQVAREVRQVLRHQRYRGESLRRDLQRIEPGQRLLGPTVNVMAFDYDLRFAGHSTTSHNLSNGPVDDFSLSVYERSSSGGCRFDFDANAESYSDDALADHRQRLMRLFETMAATPDQAIGRIELLKPEERRQILETWNDTAHPVPEATFPALFEAQIARTPEATALVFEETSLSYAELNARANRLAHHLIGMGIGPEDIVALCLPRSLDLVVSLLAILKAGAAYLPLDPDYPEARLAFMLADARPHCVLATATTAAQLPTGFTVIDLETRDLAATLRDMPATDPSDAERTRPLRPDNPAYVIYTSGSTGTPKGVVVAHMNLSTSLAARQSFYEGVPERYLLLSSISFDSSVAGVFWSLSTGGSLILPETGLRSDVFQIASTIRRHRVTHLLCLSSLYSALLNITTRDDLR
ncbi:MAG: hypothetical protein QOJ54_431, partial [Aliidongia sp.]|nr:hypothetical protein [Aliidongia sp.]